MVFKFIFTFYFWFAGAARLPACSAELEADFQLGSPGFPQPSTCGCSSTSSTCFPKCLGFPECFCWSCSCKSSGCCCSTSSQLCHSSCSSKSSPWCSSSSSCSTRWSPVSPPGNGFGGENPDREIQAALSVDDQQPKCLAGGVQDEVDLQGAFLSSLLKHPLIIFIQGLSCCRSGSVAPALWPPLSL